MFLNLISLGFAAVVLIALYSVPRMVLEAAQVSSGTSAVIAGIAVVAAAWLGTRIPGGKVGGVCRSLLDRMQKVPKTVWLTGLIVSGLLLRVLWMGAFLPPLHSDAAVYFDLAVKLFNGAPYRDTRGDYAYWYPGYPLFLYANFLVFGAKTWVPALANLELYVATVFVAWMLAQRVAGERAARPATLILAAWPNFLFCSAAGSKELLLALLLPLTLLLYLLAAQSSGRRGYAYAFLAGMVVAYAGLSHASMLLLPAAVLVFEAVRRDSRSGVVPRFGAMLLGLALVLSPWVVRNYSVFGSVVLVSTNGGEVFYRANNPKATGAHTPGEDDLFRYPEIERGKIGYQRGMQWIAAHPMQFARLAWDKQVRFLGDDSYGAYETLKRGLGIDDHRYVLAKAVCTVFWFGMWVLLSALYLGRRAQAPPTAPETGLLLLVVITFFLLHSVFESDGRFHIHLYVPLSVLAAVAVLNRCDTARARANRGSLRSD